MPSKQRRMRMHLKQAAHEKALHKRERKAESGCSTSSGSAVSTVKSNVSSNSGSSTNSSQGSKISQDTGELRSVARVKSQFRFFARGDNEDTKCGNCKVTLTQQ